MKRDSFWQYLRETGAGKRMIYELTGGCFSLMIILAVIGCLPHPYEPAGPVVSGATIGEDFYFLATPALGAEVEQVWDAYHHTQGHAASGGAEVNTETGVNRVVLYPTGQPGVAMIRPEALTLYLQHVGVLSLTPAKPEIPPGQIAAEAEPPTHGGRQTN